MKVALAFVLASAAAATLNMNKLLNFQTVLHGVNNCGSSNDHAKNLVVTVDPATPVQGQNFTTTFEYDLDKQVTSGTARYQASLNGFQVVDETDDLCVDEANDDPCPLAVGHHKDVSNTQMPSFTGKLTSRITWKDQNSEQILCVELSFKY